VSAEAHLEVYRRFQGKLHEHPLRFWPLWTSGLRTALKQRRALLALYLPLLIGTVIVGFVVYFKFTAETIVEQMPSEEMDLQEKLARSMVRNQSEELLNIVELILIFTHAVSAFSLLAVAWFASGLFCEDRKAGAHQLYFARPLTRLDYALGKFLTAATFAAFASLVPSLIICLLAAVFSPEWSFLTEQWDVPLRACAYGLVWTTVVSSLVLLCSSLAGRRSFAMLGVFGVVFLAVPVANVLGEFVHESFYALSVLDSMATLSRHVFGRMNEDVHVAPRDAWLSAIAIVVFSWSVIALRLRRLEVVA
jgi:ABC-type transport system involved in multi-copper enzyme maturation permease subunit